MHEELARICEQDQADRKGELPLNLGDRDRARRQRVTELIAEGVLQTPEDYFHAALVFQHGEKLEDYWQAHELAKKAEEQGHPTGRWLAAAAYDRWLMNQGKPQKYGTQYTAHGDGPYRLWDVDPTTTDEERAAWNVPPLAEALRRAEVLTRTRPGRRQGPKRLAEMELPGLRLEIIAFDETVVISPPDKEPSPSEELPVPTGFPPGWKLYRRGEGYYATTADGQEVINWHKVHQPLIYAWKEQAVPQLEAIELESQPAILIRGPVASSIQLFTRLGDVYYLIVGQVALDDLLRLATSIF
jgi:hypothetical protein